MLKWPLRSNRTVDYYNAPCVQLITHTHTRRRRLKDPQRWLFTTSEQPCFLEYIVYSNQWPSKRISDHSVSNGAIKAKGKKTFQNFSPSITHLKEIELNREKVFFPFIYFILYYLSLFFLYPSSPFFFEENESKGTTWGQFYWTCTCTNTASTKTTMATTTRRRKSFIYIFLNLAAHNKEGLTIHPPSTPLKRKERGEKI